jgi:hypothetical protein
VEVIRRARALRPIRFSPHGWDVRLLRRGEEFDVPLDLPEHLATHFALSGALEFIGEDGEGSGQRDLTAAELADQAVQEIPVTAKARRRMGRKKR